MSKKSLICLLAVIVMTSFVLTGCGGVSEDDIKESIDNKKAGETAKLIKSYAKQDDKEELNEAVASDFKELCKSNDYSDFVYMDKVIAKLKDEKLKAKLTEVVQKNGSNKVLAFIENDWVRRDYTELDGVVITVKNNKDDSIAIISDTKKSKDKDFTIGDVKWKNIKPMSSNEFVFEDLSKSDDDSHYEQGYATIDYDKNEIKCKISASKKSYKRGNTQVWIKKDVIDEKKETITNKDIKKDDRTNEIIVDYDYEKASKKLAEKYKKYEKNRKDSGKGIRGINDLTSRKDVIEIFGYGRVLYQSYKEDPLVTIIKYSTLGETWTKKVILNLMKRSKYSVVYNGKNKAVCIYFNSKDEILETVIFPFHTYKRVVEISHEY